MEIVHEPMGHTLDRMRRFSTSLSNVERAEQGAGATGAASESERVEETVRGRRTYREVFSQGERGIYTQLALSGVLGRRAEMREIWRGNERRKERIRRK